MTETSNRNDRKRKDFSLSLDDKKRKDFFLSRNDKSAKISP